MLIAITGADGMIGSRLSKYLQRRGDSVVEIQGDITDWNTWVKYLDKNYDVVIHLAALAGVRPSFEQPELYYKNNVEGTKLAFEFASMFDAKCLYASSSNAYEWWGNPYAATKKMNEIQAEGRKAVGMRFHTVWPGRDDMLFRKFENDEVKYINRGHYRDFVHVHDLIKAIGIIIDNFNDVDPVVDIGTGHVTPVEEVAKIFGFDGEWRDENPQGERVKTKADVEWLLQLGWTPEYNILNRDHHVDYE